MSIVSVNVAQNQTTVNVSLQGITFASTQVFYDQYFQVLTTGSTIALPNGVAYVVYVRNLGANAITVGYTPNGGSASTAAIEPVNAGFGGVFMLFETAAAGGITALTLTAASATTPAEVYLAS
jgi:hypothetical protein